MRLVSMLLLALILIGCAGQEQRQDDRRVELASYMTHASEPVDQVRFHRLSTWRVLGDDWLLIRAVHHNYFLVRVDSLCAQDLRFTHTLTVHKRSRINYLTRFDHVRLGNQTCSIRELRELDYDAFRDAQEAE